MSVVDLIFPKSCINCKRGRSYICLKCVDRVGIPIPICPVCLKPSIDGVTHTKCLTPWGIDGLFSLWKYEGIVRKALINLKYKFASDISDTLSKTIVNSLIHRHFPFSGEFVVLPIPLHKKRKKWRGFNQSEQISRNVSGRLGWKFSEDILFRHKSTSPQVELKKKDRIKNVSGIFSLNPKYKISSANRFLLFDDVYTTGSTMKEVVKTLKRKGAGKVWGLTVAR